MYVFMSRWVIKREFYKRDAVKTNKKSNTENRRTDKNKSDNYEGSTALPNESSQIGPKSDNKRWK